MITHLISPSGSLHQLRIPSIHDLLGICDAMASENGERETRETREVKNHILFEIATEVAHRGM